MKFGIALAGMALTLLGASAAQAQLSLTLNTPVTLPSGALQIGGSIANGPAPVTYTIGGANLPTANGIQYFDALEGQYSDGTNNPLLSLLPATLAPNQFLSDNDFIELIVPAGTPLTDLIFTVSDGSGTVLASTTLTVGTAAVPEPGSMALLASSLVGGSALLLRRRRK